MRISEAACAHLMTRLPYLAGCERVQYKPFSACLFVLKFACRVWQSYDGINVATNIPKMVVAAAAA